MAACGAAVTLVRCDLCCTAHECMVQERCWPCAHACPCTPSCPVTTKAATFMTRPRFTVPADLISCAATELASPSSTRALQKQSRTFQATAQCYMHGAARCTRRPQATLRGRQSALRGRQSPTWNARMLRQGLLNKLHCQVVCMVHQPHVLPMLCHLHATTLKKPHTQAACIAQQHCVQCMLRRPCAIYTVQRSANITVLPGGMHGEAAAGATVQWCTTTSAAKQGDGDAYIRHRVLPMQLPTRATDTLRLAHLAEERHGRALHVHALREERFEHVRRLVRLGLGLQEQLSVQFRWHLQAVAAESAGSSGDTRGHAIWWHLFSTAGHAAEQAHA